MGRAWVILLPFCCWKYGNGESMLEEFVSSSIFSISSMRDSRKKRAENARTPPPSTAHILARPLRTGRADICAPRLKTFFFAHTSKRSCSLGGGVSTSAESCLSRCGLANSTTVDNLSSLKEAGSLLVSNEESRGAGFSPWPPE